jgi:hypothetical protein
VGVRAKGVLEHDSVEEALTPGPVLDEVQDYLPALAARYRLSRELLLKTLIAFPLTVVERADYASALPAAARRMVERRRLQGHGREVVQNRTTHEATRNEEEKEPLAQRSACVR